MKLATEILNYCALALLATAMSIEPVKAEVLWDDLPKQLSVNNHLMAQSPTPIGVTAINFKPTETGLEIIVETLSGEKLQPLIFPQDNVLVIDIPDAVLTIANPEELKTENPTEAITEIAVTQLDPSLIRITVTGKTGAPTAEVVPSESNLVLSLTPAIAATKPAEEIEVVATQETPENNYFVPNASTATGTETPILETPFSIQVVPEDIIREQQVIQIQEALSNVSSVVYFGNTGGREAVFNIRGFGNPLGSSVPVLRDGYRLYGSFQAIPEVANLQQIEVLKGPASILYGQIEPGGIINLVSKKPLTEPFYEVELQVGSRELVRPRFDISGRLISAVDVFYRLNTVYLHERSFRDLDQPLDQISVAPIITAKIDDRTDVEFSLESINKNGPADFGLTQLGNGVAPVPRDRVVNNPDDSIATNYLSLGYSFEHRFNDNWKIRNGFRYLDYDYDYSVVALPFIVDGANITRFFAVQTGQDRSYSLYTSTVGKFATGTVKHIFSAGLDLNRSESNITSLLDFFNPSTINIFNPNYNLTPKPQRSSLPLFNDTTDTADRLGIYLQDQIYFLDNLILVAGFRYDTVTQTTTNVQTPFTAGGESQQTDDAFTPRVGLMYLPLKELAIFANYAQSFNPNLETTASGQALEPERGEGFEVGLKTELFDKKLLATLTYFNITKNNVAVTDPNNILFSIAVGQQQSQGVELDVAGELLPGWKVIGSYSYIDATVTDDTNAALIGNKLFGVPTDKLSLWTTYEIQTGNLKGLGFGIGFDYLSDRFGDLANTYKVGDSIIGNAALFYQRGQYRFALNFKNISDAYYIESVTGNDGGIYPVPPLTIIGSFSVRF